MIGHKSSGNVSTILWYCKIIVIAKILACSVSKIGFSCLLRIITILDDISACSSSLLLFNLNSINTHFYKSKLRYSNQNPN